MNITGETRSSVDGGSMEGRRRERGRRRLQRLAGSLLPSRSTSGDRKLRGSCILSYRESPICGFSVFIRGARENERDGKSRRRDPHGAHALSPAPFFFSFFLPYSFHFLFIFFRISLSLPSFLAICDSARTRAPLPRRDHVPTGKKSC